MKVTTSIHDIQDIVCNCQVNKLYGVTECHCYTAKDHKLVQEAMSPEESWKKATWNGKLIHTLSNGYLNNIKDYCKRQDKDCQQVLAEIRRRKRK